MKIEVVKPLQFQYAAGKVSGLGGEYVDHNLAGGPGSAYAIPQCSVQYNTNGTVDVFYAAQGYFETFNWYTGGTPSGPTTFQLVVTNIAGSNATFAPGNPGTYNGNTYFAVAANDTIAISSALIAVTMNITRGGQTISHDWILRANVEM